jgi:PBP1b-binding outer membrane lipoprotein LpoB
MQKVIGISIIILLMIGGCSQQKEGRQHEKKQEMLKMRGKW